MLKKDMPRSAVKTDIDVLWLSAMSGAGISDPPFHGINFVLSI